MNAFVIYYVSGWAFYSGMALILSALGLSFCRQWIIKNYLVKLLGVVGGLNIFFSATPVLYILVVWLYILLVIQLLISGSDKIKLKYKMINSAILALIIFTAFFMELPYWFLEPVRLRTNNIVVIGDSISGGIGFNGEQTWSDILKNEYNYNVANKSVGGGTVATGINSLRKAEVGENDLIIIEIGGNDLFNGTSADKFYQDLDRLLADAKTKTPIVMLLELPLPFLKVSFGRSQRELAAKYNVPLVPKHHFANVLSGADSTIDGLHLSNKGHRKMADMILKHIIEPTSKVSTADF
jgi:acyl-CoA thioesterase I